MKMNLLLISLLTSCFFFLACESESDTGTNEDGRLIVRLTDAPFPHDLVSEANVIISKIELRSKNSEYEDEDEMEMDDEEIDDDDELDNEDDDEMDDEEDDEMDDEEDDDDEMDDDKGKTDDKSPFITISEEVVEVNLLDLTNGITMTLVDADIPMGEYDLIRIHVTGVNVVLEDGRVFDLKVPSGNRSGIKVFIKPSLNVVGGLTSELLLDFDVSRSFVPRGNIRNGNFNGFIFKPVIKATNLSTSGTLKGLVFTSEMEMASEAIRINSGGTEYTDGSGNLFIADEYFTGGDTFETMEPIEGTTEDAVYQTERFGDFSYEVPVQAAGLYDIRLHFAEIFFGVGDNTDGVGTRVFNVNIEGNQVLANFDILAEIDPGTALVKVFEDIDITDGFASIELISLEENAKISGIEIVPVDTSNEGGKIGLAGAQVSIIAADTLNTTTFTDASGMYMVMGLLAGDYDVEVQLENYITQRVNGVPITEANQTVQDFEMEPEP